jgi:HlyD family secretion protein
VSGNIKALYADFNTKVKKGQLVAVIDPQSFQARVDQARAALDSARAAIVSAQAQIEKSNADIASAQAAVANQVAAVAKSKAAVRDAQNKSAASQSLAKEGIVSKEDLITAQSNYDQALAEQQAANAQVDAAQHQVQAAQAQKQVSITLLSSANSQVKQAQAGLDQALVDLNHTQITAPVDGTVVARRMDVGQTVAASFQAPTIFEIAQDLTKMQVDTNVDEADVGVVKLGQPARFSVDAYPTRTFEGQVTQIRQAPINVQNVVTYDVVVAVGNPDLKLYPGMTANVKILTNREDNVLRIPNAALRFRPPSPAGSKPITAVHAAGRRQAGEQTVWILTGNKPQSVAVKLGITDGTYTAVDAGGLQEGEEVITGSTGAVAARGSSAAARPRGPGF